MAYEMIGLVKKDGASLPSFSGSLLIQVFALRTSIWASHAGLSAAWLIALAMNSDKNDTTVCMPANAYYSLKMEQYFVVFGFGGFEKEAERLCPFRAVQGQ